MNSGQQNGNVAVADGAQAAGVKLTLDEVRARLTGKTGKKYWRSLDELAETDGFKDLLEREFPRHAGELVDGVSRRGFMKLAGASLALAGMAGCTKQPDEQIYPYVEQPEDLVLGKPMYFATAFPFATGAQPLLVKTEAFRPIKIDGNPDHPLAQGSIGGGSDPITQGTLLDLYDPFRSQDVMYRGTSSTWAEFQSAFSRALESKKGSGQGVYVLSSTVTSPTLAAQIRQAKAAFPAMEWLQWNPVNSDSARRASMNTDAQYKLDDADVIVSLDADFLGGISFPGFTTLAKQYGRRRKLELDPVAGLKTTELNRLYCVEPTPTVTGFKAEHRLALHPAEIEVFAQALASATGAGGAAGGDVPESARLFLSVLCKDLKANGGRSVVIPGEYTSPAVHAAARQINTALGNVGKTVFYGQTVNPMPAVCGDDIRKLTAALQAGQVEWLLILGPNPVYDAPADLNFEAALRGALARTTVVHQGYHFNQTARISTWHIPEPHYLEMWTDARAYDGTVSIVQPMIAPLYHSHSAHEIVQVMLGEPYSSPSDVVRATWPQLKDDKTWRRTLTQGWVDGTAFAGGGSSNGAAMEAPTAVQQGAAGEDQQQSNFGLPAGARVGPSTDTSVHSAADLVVVFRPDPNVHDGRYSGVGWLQEMPKQITKLSWDNAALISIPTAARLGVEEGDVIEIAVDGRKVEAPVALSPGAADNTVTVYLGGGRTHSGMGNVGFDAYRIRTSSAPLYAPATVRKTGKDYDLCIVRSHYTDHRGAMAQKGNTVGVGQPNRSIEGNEAGDRAIIRSTTMEEYRKEPRFAQDGLMEEAPEKDETLLYPWNYDVDSKNRGKHAWSMAIDQNSCIGCNACIVSCYAENNIPVVGRQQVKIGRNMQWIRIDTYFEGDLDAPKAHFQPMTCQHCENAGCEQVCPVGATVHTPEGLNTMVYNRCVGTRYCSNNCPYKVRRFNWLLYSDYDTESLKFMRNPQVSVRSRGVMEKCSYCMQRIEFAKIEADTENRPVRDGEIVTACQQACPTDAILFGDLNDPHSKVSQRKRSNRNYAVLGDIGFRPRTTYIAEVTNPHAELAGEVS